MKFPQITCFSLWSLTAFVAAGFLLSLRTPPIEALNHIGNIDSVSYKQADIAHLFQKPAATLQPQTGPSQNDSMRLQGIVFSNIPSQSRALIQISGDNAKHFAIGSRLPNGGNLVEISKREISYEIDGVRKSLVLPKS